MRESYLVCYDIRHEKRLARIFRFLKQKGLHLQYSVFFCRFTWNELIELKEAMRAIIDEREDDVRVYPLPAQMKVTVMGRGDRVPEGVTMCLQ